MRTHNNTHTQAHAHTRGVHPNFMVASCVDLRGKIIILKRKYCPTPFGWHFPFTLSLDALFARICNAICLWLLMTIASLYSPILLAHLSTLMNHLYSVCLYLCLCMCIVICVCLRYLNCRRVAPCVYEPIIFTYFSPNDFEMSRGGGIEITLAATRSMCEGPEV